MTEPKTGSQFTKVLVAVDLTDEARQVVDKACAVAAAHDAELSFLHVVEPVGYAYGGDIPMDLSELQQQMEDTAKEQLNALASSCGVPSERQTVSVGRASSEIHRICEEQDISLVVMGSHGRTGLQRLLGSTAAAVLHGATCDVLAVHIE